MKLVPNEVAWLAETVAKFSRATMLETPFGAYSELVIATAIPMRESHIHGADAEAIGVYPGDGTGANRDLGVWQISTRWHWQKLLTHRWWDPFDNARMARLVYDETAKAFPGRGSGFTAWSVFNGADDADADADPEWGAGIWHTMIAPALLGVGHPWEPINPHTTGWRRTGVV